MTIRIKITVPVALTVEIDARGAVTWTGAPERPELVAAVEAASTVEQRVARYAHGTRSRLAEGLVRVIGNESLVYGKFVRSTKLHHVIERYGNERKYRRDLGSQVGGDVWRGTRIHSEDLAALNGRAVRGQTGMEGT